MARRYGRWHREPVTIPRTEARMVHALLLAALGACGRPPVVEAPYQPSAPAEPPVKETTETARRPAAPAPDTAEREGMRRHFAAVAAMRDAVIAGRLPQLRAAAETFREEELAQEHPPDWGHDVAAMREATADSMVAESLADAAAAVARLAGACGDCHRTLDAVPRIEMPPQPHATRGVAAVMELHAWSVDRMWDGIVFPSEDCWLEGTAAFEALPGCGESPARPQPPGADSMCGRMQALARAAHVRDQAGAKIEVYGQLLATCADCHQAAGVSLPPAPAPGS